MKVTLLGDSIRRIGYGTLVPKLLGSEYELYQPEENCRYSKYTLRGLFDWRKDMEGSRIVHWNNGLWDVCNLYGDGAFSTENEYVENMLRIADLLLLNHDKVIFATTTPVREGNMHNTKSFIVNSLVERYNEIIVPLLEEKGVIINDLYSVVTKDVDCYINKEDNIHLTEEGAKVCAMYVADIIKNTAHTLDESKPIVKCNISQNQMGLPV
ncbi:MAG: SGNH/GDSL hydrolase family protein [Clostridia bacterium]|nr:SGNH/GDSL hydrolase family protein [Clostridia bacterium]